MIRKPAVAGQFYPADAEKLKETIRGMVDANATKEEAIGLILPHAGLIYSGPVAGATLSRIKIKGTAIILGPNHSGRGQPLSIMTEGSWETPLGEVAIASALAKEILKRSQYLKEDPTAHQQEHSLEVQIPFLQYLKPDVRIVPIVMGLASEAAYQEIGREIARAVKETDSEAVIIASSDMTHYETDEAARRKDAMAIDSILKLDADGLLDVISEFNISMCGFAPTVALITAARELGAARPELVRYQTSGDVTGDRSAVVGYAGIIFKAMSPLVKLAKDTVAAYVTQGQTLPPPEKPTPEMESKAGVFVSIHKHGGLRGCIGTFEPQRENVALEIITNAISAATQDPRFPPVAPDELSELDYSVDVLTAPEAVENKDELDPKTCGLIVECGLRRGLLLPDLEGVDTVEQQLSICCQKAGIDPGEPINLYTFKVKRYK